MFPNLLRGKWDVVVLSCVPYQHIYSAGFILLRRGIPTIIAPFLHFEFGLFLNRFCLKILQRSNAILAASNYEKRRMIKLGLNEKKIYVVPLGVDPTEWKSCNGHRFRLKYGFSADDKIILFVGFKCEDKGALTLISSLEKLWPEYPNIKLVAIGEGDNLWYKHLANLDPEVRPHIFDLGDRGYILNRREERMQILDAFTACDLFVMPSRIDSFGIVYLEAWMVEKPVIGAWIGAMPEVINHEIDGFLVPFGDADILAQRIRELLENDDLRKKMGRHGKEKVLAKHTWSHTIKVMKNIFNEII